MPDWALAGIGAVAGLLAGSYLTVLAARVPARENVLHPPGRCPACGTRLRAVDMIPLAGCGCAAGAAPARPGTAAGTRRWNWPPRCCSR